MYAIVESGGKQHRVCTGDVLRLERMEAEPGDVVHFDKVLMVNDGKNLQLGEPIVPSARVSAKVNSHGRHDTIEVFKYKRRKKYRRTQGHRQWYTEVEITDIKLGTSAAKAKPEVKEEKEAPAKAKKAAATKTDKE